MAPIPSKAIPVAATPACRQVGICIVLPFIGGDVDGTDCGRDGFNLGGPYRPFREPRSR